MPDIKFEMTEDGSILFGRHTVPVNDYEARNRFGITAHIDAGNTPTPYVGPTEMDLWKEKMAMSDDPLPRWAEDLVDGAISSQTQKLADDKKVLRATKP